MAHQPHTESLGTFTYGGAPAAVTKPPHPQDSAHISVQMLFWLYIQLPKRRSQGQSLVLAEEGTNIFGAVGRMVTPKETAQG